ncbi:elastin-like [Bacillus rossius redtenbacheri]|uniref:elastin-like n=1 Tax=Bacillus rossius redtenbacheri TaxID=93214 RepID=UPI002FDE29FD
MIKFLCVLLVPVAIIHVARSQGFGDGPGGRIVGPTVGGRPGGPAVGGRPGGPAVGGRPGGLLGVEGRPGGSPTVGGRPDGLAFGGKPGGPAVGGRPGGPAVGGRPGGLLGVEGRPGGSPTVGGRPGGPVVEEGLVDLLLLEEHQVVSEAGQVVSLEHMLASGAGGSSGRRTRRHGDDLSGRRPSERPGALGCARGCPSNDGRLGESSPRRGTGEIEING